MPESPLHVVCDRCRAEGLAGEDPFEAFGALLDFEPVPRKTNRADGWDAQLQRAFIAILSLCGSEGRAARAVGRSPFGVTQLQRAEANQGFLAACEAAKAMAADERGRRLAEAVRSAAEERSGRRPADPPWSRAASRRPPATAAPEAGFPTEAEAAAADRDKMRLLQILIDRYLIKLAEERRRRLEGRIAEADFYLRQITVLEVSLDLLSGDGMKLLGQVRRDGWDLFEIAETPLSRLLDEARRRHWEAHGDAPRPDPPRHLYVEKDGFTVEPTEAAWGEGGDWRDGESRFRAFEEQHRRDAKAQVEWEAKARRDYEERLDSDASSSAESRAEPGGLRSESDRTDVTKPPS